MMLYKYFVVENTTLFVKTEVLCKTKTELQCVSMCYADIKIIGTELFYWKCLEEDSCYKIEFRKIDLDKDMKETIVKAFSINRSDKKNYNLVGAVMNKSFVQYTTKHSHTNKSTDNNVKSSESI